MNQTPQKKILIVDDEPDVVTYLKTFLEDNGFVTIEAMNGKEGMDKAISEKPDLITLDITMPEESGVRMFRDLQANQDTADIPVIIITGVSSEFRRFLDTRKQVRSPAGYFDKPINTGEMLAKIKEILRL